MATKTQAEIKSALKSAYDTAQSTDPADVDAFADAIATVIHDAITSIIIQLDSLQATDSLSGPVSLIASQGSVVE